MRNEYTAQKWESSTEKPQPNQWKNNKTSKYNKKKKETHKQTDS